MVLGRTHHLADRLHEASAAARARPALTLLSARGQPVVLSYGQLFDRVSQRGGEAPHMEPGVMVALALGPHVDDIATLVVLMERGVPVLLLGPHIGWHQMVRVALDAGARYLASGRQWHPLEPDTPFAGGEPDFAVVQLTSGSTGGSRLALRPESELLLEIASVRERLSIEPGDTVVVGSSIAHSYGLIGGLLTTLSTGAHAVLASQAAAFDHSLRVAEPDIVFGLGPQYRALLGADLPARTLAGARALLSAGAPLSLDVFYGMLERFDVPVRQDYGTTETGTICIDSNAPVVPGVAGSPLGHLEVRLDGPASAAGYGEILVRSAAAQGYVCRGRLEPALDAQGWYHTGDLGARDAAGHLHLAGRLRPDIERAGLVIPAARLESALELLPGVREAAVALDAANRLYVTVAACDLSEEEVRGWCARMFGAEMVPDRVEVRPELPRSQAGKVLHRYLVQSGT